MNRPRQRRVSPSFTWQLDGWEPLLVTSSMIVDAKFLVISGTYRERLLSLYLYKDHIASSTSSSDLLKNSLIQMRPASENNYSLELYTPEDQIIRTTGYISIDVATAKADSTPQSLNVAS